MIVCSSCDKRPAFALHHQHHSLWEWSSRLSMFQPNTCVLVYCWSILQSLSWLLTSFSKSPEGESKITLRILFENAHLQNLLFFFCLGTKNRCFGAKSTIFSSFGGTWLFKLIDPFPVKPHWHLHEIIYSIEDPIFPLIHCFVCVWKLSVAKMAKSTLGIMDVEHFAQNMQ